LHNYKYDSENEEDYAMTKVFIDGSSGTTGLRIYERLGGREDIELIRLPEEKRRSADARREAMLEADIVFLCLPDAAAGEAMELMEEAGCAVIDTSTAHRTAPGWVYGFPELTGRREQLRSARRIANPGCHASGFIALVAPLVERGVLSARAQLSCFSITGYSGGGKSMIAQYTAPDRDDLLEAPRQYGLSQSHKHLAEMTRECTLEAPPLFSPIVAPYYAGMEVTVPLHAGQVSGGLEAVKSVYRSYYREGLVHFNESAGEEGYLSAGAFAGRDDMEIAVFGSEERMLLTARFDNLGKGASGAAIQNMNLLLGVEETRGLTV